MNNNTSPQQRPILRFSCRRSTRWQRQVQRLHTASSALWDVASLLAQQPHARRKQLLTSRQTIPAEGSSESIVHSTRVAALVPESAGPCHSAVICALVVVTVIRREHHVLVIAERIFAGVTWVKSWVPIKLPVSYVLTGNLPLCLIYSILSKYYIKSTKTLPGTFRVL